MNETHTHTHTHTHTRRKPWRKLILFLSFFIPLIGFLACKDDNLTESNFNGEIPEKVDFNTLSNQAQTRIYKRSYILAVKKYNAVALTKNSETFYHKYGQTDMRNSLMVNFDAENSKFIFVIPFKNQEIRNKLVLIGYFEGHKIIYRFYDITKINEYLAEPNYPYFIDHLDAVFHIISNQRITSRGYCDPQFLDEGDCVAMYCSPCYGCYFIITCNDKGDGDGDWDWNGSEWELPGVEVEAEGNDHSLDYEPLDPEEIYPIDEDIIIIDMNQSGSGNSNQNDPNVPIILAPCESATAKVNDSTYNAKVQYLRGRFNLLQETGFMESTDHQYSELQINPNNSTMFVHVTSATLGIMHVHFNDWENNDGVPMHMIRIFSPRDVIRFLRIAYLASQSGTDLANIYLSMYSSTGSYMLKFTGNAADLPSASEIRDLDRDIEVLNDYYRDKLGDSTYNLKRDFLKFMNHMGVEGVSLYQINNDTTVKEIKLNANSTTTITIPCN